MASDDAKPYFETWWFEWLVLSITCVLGWVLWKVLDHPYLATGAEQVPYLELAKSVASGKGFFFLHTNPPMPFLNGPPLYPLLLAGLIQVLGDMDLPSLIGPVKTLNLWLYLFSIFLVFFFINRQIRKPYSFVITFLYAVAPFTIASAGAISSEMTYVVFSFMALIAIDKYFEDKGASVTKGQLFWCCLWMLTAILTRNIGLSLLGSFFLLSIQRMKMKQCFILLGIVLACLAPWYLREIYYRNLYPQQVAPIQQVEAQESSAIDSIDQPDTFLERTWLNANLTLRKTTQSILGDLDFERFDGMVVRKLHLQNWQLRFSDVPWIRWTLGGLIALGVMYGFYCCSGIGSLYLTVYMAMACCMPVEKNGYLMPVLPLLLFYLYMGVMKVGEWMKQLYLPVSKVAVPILTVLIGFNSVHGHLEHLHQDRLEQAYLRPADVGRHQKGYLKALQWINTHTPADARLVAQRPSDTFVYTERRTQPLPGPFQSSNRVLKTLLQSDYILEEDKLPALLSSVKPVLSRYQQFFRLVYNDPDSKIRVWQVLRP